MAPLGKKTAIATGSRKNHTWSITLTESTTSIDTNTSGMTIKLTMGESGSTWAYWGAKIQYRVRVVNKDNEKDVYYNTGWRNAPDHYPNANSNLTWIAGDTFNVGHNEQGKRNVRVYFELVDNANGKNENGYYYTPGNASGSLDYTLSTIPRYLSFTSFTNTSRAETSATFSWVVDNARDYTQYSLNNGSWTDAGDTGTTSGSFTISGLTANTTYSLKIKCKRTDSQLWTESSPISFSTYNWPYVSAVETTALTIGNSQKLTLYNPLSRPCTVYMKQNNSSGTTLWSGSTSTTSVSFTPTADVKDNLYKSIPNSKSGTGYYYCIYSGHELAGKTGTYTCVESECKPTFGANPITYIDANTKTKNIMQDGGVSIVQNQSDLQITFSAATLQKNAGSIAKYKVVLGGTAKEYTAAGTYSLGVVNLTQNTNLKLSAVDSRGYESNVYEKTVTIVPWSKPTIDVVLQRQNKFDETADLQIYLSSFSSLNGKNEAYKKLQYSYKISTAKDFDADKKDLPLTKTEIDGIIYYIVPGGIANLDQNKAYSFTINVQDGLSNENYIYPLDRGIPILTIDAEKLGVGVNCFPEGEGLYVKHIDNVDKNGVLYYQGRDIATVRNMSTSENKFHPVVTQKTKNGTWTIGGLGGQDGLYFSYVADNDYKQDINNHKTYKLDTDGRFNGGVQVTSGTGAPNNANGANGDVYIQI